MSEVYHAVQGSSEGKICLACKNWHPLSNFRKDGSRKDGLRAYCKVCQDEKNAVWAKNNPEKIRAANRRYARKHSKKRATYLTDWRKTNPEKVATINKRSRKKNKEKVLERNRNYAQSHSDKKCENVRQWRRANPEKRRDQNRNRRALKVGNGGSHTTQQWKELCAYYGYRCLCCHEEKPLVRDHVIPLVLGGTNDISNIQPLCRSCNCKKWAKHIDYREVYHAI